MRAISVLGCLGLLVLGQGATAQQYPPAPIGRISPAAVDLPGSSGAQITPTPPPFGSDPVDAPQIPGVTGTSDTDVTSAVPVPVPEVLGAVVSNPGNSNGNGVLPLTGIDIGVLVAWALILMLFGGVIVKTVREHQHRRDREREQRRSRRPSRREVPFLDTSAFTARSGI